MGHSLFFGSSRKVGEANKGLGEAPKSCTRKEHESATNSIARRGQGGTSSLFVCPLQGQGGTLSLFVCPLWGLGQRPNCSASDQSQGSHQQRRRQRSVPASNFARPQTRPQAPLPPRFHEDNLKKAGDLPAFFSALLSIHCRSAEPASFAAGRFSAPRRYPAANCIP